MSALATAVLFNSGLFFRDQAVYDALHAPIQAINNIPIFISNDKLLN